MFDDIDIETRKRYYLDFYRISFNNLTRAICQLRELVKDFGLDRALDILGELWMEYSIPFCECDQKVPNKDGDIYLFLAEVAIFKLA